MKLEQLTALLRHSGADDWEFTRTLEDGWEFYGIRHALDQHRAKRVETCRVKVFRKSADGQYLGSASGEVPPTASEAEAKKLLEDLLLAASFVRNPAYSLGGPRAVPAFPPQETDPAQMARSFLETLDAVAETATEDINSWELFVSRQEVRLLTSRGIDLSAVVPAAMLEAVVNAREPGTDREIELYRMWRSGGCDREGLLQAFAEAMRFGRDKLRAGKTPALGRADVVFSTDAARELYGWFIHRMNAAARVRGWSDWEIGQPVAEMAGDRISVRAVPSLPNSPRNMPFDEEGSPVREMEVLRAGVPVCFHGARMFAQQLGLEDSFIPGNWSVTGGTAGAEELRQGRFLEVAEFSDFQVNPMTGDIAGEIRLAYWHDGEKTVPVSGGSVSGSMNDFVKTLRASRAQRQFGELLIPAMTRLQGVTVTGA